MRAFGKSSIILCALALSLAACDPVAGVTGTTSGTPINRQQFPSVDNTILGGWNLPNPSSSTTERFFINANQVGVETTCTSDSGSVVVSVIAPATLSGNTITLQQAVSAQGTNCGINVPAFTATFNVLGDYATVTFQGTPQTWTRIR